MTLPHQKKRRVKIREATVLFYCIAARDFFELSCELAAVVDKFTRGIIAAGHRSVCNFEVHSFNSQLMC